VLSCSCVCVCVCHLACLRACMCARVCVCVCVCTHFGALSLVPLAEVYFASLLGPTVNATAPHSYVAIAFDTVCATSIFILYSANYCTEPSHYTNLTKHILCYSSTAVQQRSGTNTIVEREKGDPKHRARRITSCVASLGRAKRLPC
jgi:hypothetical protein